MILKRIITISLVLLLSSCATEDNRGRISELDKVKIQVKDVEVKGGLDKAMQAYQKFLNQTPESQLTPEAMRRLADLKIEKTYGTVTDISDSDADKKASPKSETEEKTGKEISKVENKKVEPKHAVKQPKSDQAEQPKSNKVHSKAEAIADVSESQKAFEKRATQHEDIKSSYGNAKVTVPAGEPGSDLQNADASQAIALYNKLLAKYPNYERNDQVLYQLSRAYDETGQVDKAMGVMNRLIKRYPKSRYIDEVQFRRGEYFFTRKKYLDAEDAYGAVLSFGVGSVYYAHALFKKGWTFYKQELYEEAIGEFIKLLDYKVSIGYDFEQTTNEIEKKRTDDTFRVISLSFSNLGGAKTVQDFFTKNGSRAYEDSVYSHLAEFYFTKRRYSDAAQTYNAFIEKNPFHKKSPFFSMRVIDIYMKGRFPKLVIEAKKQYASTYGVHAEYWKYFDQAEFPEVLGYVKTNIFDLAKYYHSRYQNKKYAKDKPKNFAEASHWYKEFLNSFPKDKQAPAINFQLAELLLENKNYNEAAKEYERTAYDYPHNDKSEQAAYAAVFAYRQFLKVVPEIRQLPVKRNIIRSSLRLVDTYPHHKKATVVLGAAVDDLFNMQDFKPAIKNGLRLIGEYPNADDSILRGAWLVVAHSNFQLENFADAETGYTEVLRMTGEKDKNRSKLVENLAASIYKQGEQAKKEEDYKSAVWHFLRIAEVAPNSKIRPTAEYDAAAVLIQTMDLERAVKVLLAFRQNYPGNKLQHDVTKKIAYSYKELGRFTLAGKEYERVAAESKDEELIREAMLSAADMYDKAKDTDNSLRVYHQFVVRFPKPLEFALETYYKIAMLYKSIDDLDNYRKTLRHIITADANAGAERTDRTRYLAAEASLVIIEPRFDEFVAIKLVNPLKKSMKRKQTYMKSLIASYSKLVEYKVADVTAASTYYLAEIYYNFDRSLLESEVPKGLSALELEEFKTQLEDQAYPFEEKAISVHEKNVELLAVGVYSPWIDRSIEKLAKLVPARFAKYEERIPVVDDMNLYRYSSPRFVREDAATVYIEKLNIFRYVSQNLKKNLQNQSQPAEISKENGPNAASGSPATTGPGNTVSESVGETNSKVVVPAGVSTQGNTSPETQKEQPAVTTTPATGKGPATESVKGSGSSSESEVTPPVKGTDKSLETESGAATEKPVSQAAPAANKVKPEAVGPENQGTETEQPKVNDSVKTPATTPASAQDAKGNVVKDSGTDSENAPGKTMDQPVEHDEGASAKQSTGQAVTTVTEEQGATEPGKNADKENSVTSPSNTESSVSEQGTTNISPQTDSKNTPENSNPDKPAVNGSSDTNAVTNSTGVKSAPVQGSE